MENLNNITMVDDMKAGEILSGFYFNIGRKEFFVKTDYKNKTQVLAKKILRKLLLPENPDTIKELLYYIIPANCQIKHLEANSERMVSPEGKYYYNIFGKNFSGYGSEDINDGKTIVFEI